MVVKNIVKEGRYYDSVLLLRVSQRAKGFEGVREAAVVMATEPNKEILKNLGLYEERLDKVTPNDLVISLDVEEGRVEEVVQRVEDELTGERRRIEEEYFPKSLETALERLPGANMAAISIPGEHAYREASEALDRGLNLFIFSSNVPLEKELGLKTRGREKGLMVMGPDCGTAIINGVIMGFGNVVDRGPVGMVAASGTGIQQVTTLLHRMGVGITHAIGTGGNDLSEEVGGATMIEGIRLLEEDGETELIMLISKPPSPGVEERVLEHVKGEVTKPVLANFIGGDPRAVEEAGLTHAGTLEEAAFRAVSMLKGEDYARERYDRSLEPLARLAEEEWGRLSDGQRYIRGLYSGGTLSSEAQLVLRPLIGYAYSNSPLDPRHRLENPNRSREHTFIDLGGEEFVAGRLHPIIDPTIRRQRILREGEDPETAVILIDVVIGYGSHEDPAGALIPEIREAREKAEARGGYLPVVASVVGTELDPQNLAGQEEKLRGAGVVVLPSNARAAIVAGLIATRGEGSDKLEEAYGGGRG
ncbi:MAG: acyl-CoA synthetase FdrA [Candidatus Bathyarchaeota archaeon]|nr:acyl-CoA synthetase FdrA [Candidatus Bathyarchaeota archaeon]